VIPHPWRTDNVKAKLKAPGLQEGELLQLLMVPSLGLLPSLLGISRHVEQATSSLLGHIVGPTHLRKLTLEEGDLSDKALCLLASRG
jgi:hypothetical protein